MYKIGVKTDFQCQHTINCKQQSSSIVSLEGGLLLQIRTPGKGNKAYSKKKLLASAP